RARAAKPKQNPPEKPEGKPAAKPDEKPEAKSQQKSEASPDKVPELEAPRVPRDIKDTAAPRLDPEPDLPLELDKPLERPKQDSLPSLKGTSPGKTGWKSKSLEAPQKPPEADAAKFAGPKSESARFEHDGDPADLSKPLVKIVIEGNKTIKTEEITKLLKTREGRVADPKQIKEDIRTLISKRWFF